MNYVVSYASSIFIKKYDTLWHVKKNDPLISHYTIQFFFVAHATYGSILNKILSMRKIQHK
jgi:hypothetical protein